MNGPSDNSDHGGIGRQSIDPYEVNAQSRLSLSSNSDQDDDPIGYSVTSPGPTPGRPQVTEPQRLVVREDSHTKKSRFGVDGTFSPYPPSDASPSVDVEMDNISEPGYSDNEETGLTGTRNKRPRSGGNELVDAERAPVAVKTSKQERQLADMAVIKRSAINVLLIGLWYLFSLSISLYNKWMFDPKHLNFSFPLFTTSFHMVIQFILASTVLYFIPRFRPGNSVAKTMHHENPVNEDDETAAKRPLMSKTFYLTRIGPCGAATGLDIGLGNTALKSITLTFFTMCKSSALAFVLLFAFVFKLETPSVKLVLIIATMIVGVVLMVFGETAFVASGFMLVISSAFFSGFRWALTQILLLRNPATSNPFSSIFFLAPIMFLTLFIIAVPVEGFAPLWEGLGILTQAKGVIGGILLLLFPGTIAFCMTAAEFALLKRTSVVTLSICGIFKEVVTISAAGIAFDDKLTPINIGGLIVTILTIAAYNYIKITKMRKDAREEVHENLAADRGEGEGMLTSEERR